MSAVNGVAAAVTARALVVAPGGSVLAVAPLRRRGAGRSPAPDTLEPDEATYTFIDPPARYTSAAPRRPGGFAPPAGMPSSRYGRRGRRGRAEVLQAYAPYYECVGLYIDLWA